MSRGKLIGVLLLVSGIGTGGPQSVAASSNACRLEAGSKVTIANAGCANGWARDTYKGWGRDPDPSSFADGYGHRRILKSQGAKFEVRAVNRDTRMAKIQVSRGEELWVNFNALKCEGGENAGDRSVDEGGPSAGEEACPPPLTMPIDPDKARALVNAANSDQISRLLDRADAYVDATYAKVRADNATLLRLFAADASGKPRTADERRAALDLARAKLGRRYEQLAGIYGPRCSCDVSEWREGDFKPVGSRTAEQVRAETKRTCESLGSSSSVERMERTCRSVRDAHMMLERALGQRDPVAAFVQAFEAASASDHPKNEQVAARLVVLYGLGLEDKVNTGKGDEVRLHYFNVVSAKGQMPLAEVHNGYLLNAGRSTALGSALDCGGFAMTYLYGMTRKDPPPHSTRSVASVEDFKLFHDYLAGRRRESNMSDYAACFKVVSFKDGEMLVPGDLVASNGHIAVVRDYDPVSREITTVESRSGNFGTTGYGRLPLLEPNCQGWGADSQRAWSNRPIRADLRILRFVGGAGCPLLKAAQAPSAGAFR